MRRQRSIKGRPRFIRHETRSVQPACDGGLNPSERVNDFLDRIRLDNLDRIRVYPLAPVRNKPDITYRISAGARAGYWLIERVGCRSVEWGSHPLILEQKSVQLHALGGQDIWNRRPALAAVVAASVSASTPLIGARYSAVWRT